MIGDWFSMSVEQKAQASQADGDTSEDRMDGLICVIADFLCYRTLILIFDFHIYIILYEKWQCCYLTNRLKFKLKRERERDSLPVTSQGLPEAVGGSPVGAGWKLIVCLLFP